MFNIFKITVNENDYNLFVDKNKVSNKVIEILSLKIIKGIELNVIETAIAYGRINEINNYIKLYYVKNNIK